MAEGKLATLDEVKAYIGRKIEESMEIDGTVIKTFCECIGDPNPIWKETAPPGLVTTAMISSGAMLIGVPLPYKRSVAGGADWEFFKPIRKGDKIFTSHEFAELQEKSSDKGPRALMVYKSTHKNQRGEVVAISTNTIMSY
jgi:acyl dehydratase